MAGSFDPAFGMAEEEEEPQPEESYKNNKTIAITTMSAPMKIACFLLIVTFLSDIIPPP